MRKIRLLEEIYEDVAECARCQGIPGVGTVPVSWRGSPDAACMLVGEGPGEQEEREGRPFVGAAGKLLDTTLSELGYDVKHGFYVTNIVKYRAFKVLPDGSKTNKPPTAKQTAAEREFLEREIAVVAPALIVALGAHAGRWFLGKDFKLTRDRGELYDWRDITVLPTYHPAAILRAYPGDGRDKLEDFRADLAKIETIVRPGRAA